MCPPPTAEMRVLCPTPRRLCRVPTSRSVPAPLPRSPAPLESCDSELLHIFLRTEGGESGQIDSSPPFFCGSPPSRPANPVVDDPCFGEQEPLVIPHFLSDSSNSIRASSLARRGSYVYGKFGFKPPAVRIEGFDCLNCGGCQCCSVTSVA